jgi:hypothetical protein
MFALLGCTAGRTSRSRPRPAWPRSARRGGQALAELADASLAAEHRPGRYVLHDLVRGYAAGQPG